MVRFYNKFLSHEGFFVIALQNWLLYTIAMLRIKKLFTSHASLLLVIAVLGITISATPSVASAAIADCLSMSGNLIQNCSFENQNPLPKGYINHSTGAVVFTPGYSGLSNWDIISPISNSNVGYFPAGFPSPSGTKMVDLSGFVDKYNLKMNGEQAGSGSSKLVIPEKVIIERDGLAQAVTTSQVQENDIIVDVVIDDNMKELLGSAKTVVWNGPLGWYEKGYTQSTIDIIANLGLQTTSIVGGGDTVTVIRKEHLEDKISFLSTGGGAMLEYLQQGTLVGLDVLK